MKIKKRYILLILLSILIILVPKFRFKSDKSEKPYVILVSMDGFRWDYPDKVFTPNLDKIEKIGVKAKSIQSAFPSKTFPNHYTLATGLYPDNHGIVFNEFYDPNINSWYRVSDRSAVEDGKYYGGEPIWVTAEKQGVKTASFFWVGSEAPVKGIQPSIWKKYEHNFPYEDRIDSVIAWLELPEKIRPHLITLYFDQPDGWGHKIGPDSELIKPKLMYLDSLIGILRFKLDSICMNDKVNLIITTDHGMGSISESKVVKIDKILKPYWLEKHAGSNPFYMFEPKTEYFDSVLIALKSCKHIKTWKKENIPEYLHFGKNPRVMSIISVADSSWSLVYSKDVKDYKNFNGTHGYDPTNLDMHGIFYAFGPAFKKNYKQNTFENIHIYTLIAEILNLHPVRNDGNIKYVQNMLKGK